MTKNNNTQKIKLLAFDLDDTLTASKAKMENKMAKIIKTILESIKVAIITGGNQDQIEKQVVEVLRELDANLDNFLSLPTCGTKFYKYSNKKAQIVYIESLTQEEKSKIINALNKAFDESGLKVEKVYGNQLEDRETQITFSALGNEAPLEVKSTWDPDMKKRNIIKSILEKYIPEFDIMIGGKSSIDVTRKGINKEYGMRKIIEYTGFNINEILFFGDKLMPGGNDYPVRNTGVRCIQVKDHYHTAEVLEDFINNSLII